MTFDQRIANTCPARHTCKQHEKQCSTACSWYIDLWYQIELSGITKRFQAYNVDTLPEDTYALELVRKWSATAQERISRGEGLYFYGSTGRGKTTVAAAIAMSYIINETRARLKSGSGSQQLVMYANVPDLLDLIKRGFDNEENARSAATTIDRLRTAPLAIIDDIGAEKPSEWARERLLTIIGARYDNNLATIITSNLTYAELNEPLGQRIRSRIEGLTTPLEFKGADRRKKI